ncbi:MAG: NADH-quinone oxidoreductase subunit A [Deltaproteobacteria bacterium]|nr:NADH-quinone oxidoreductase subunit A [Deltaproteobacteria bacterium]
MQAHLPLLIALAVAVLLGGFILVLSAWLGPRRASSVKEEAFECGNPSSGPARDRFGVKFYLVAILFLVFDIEAVFIYPWAITFADAVRGHNQTSPLALLLEMLAFVAVIIVGLVYAWRKGALEWGPTPAMFNPEPKAGSH